MIEKIGKEHYKNISNPNSVFLSYVANSKKNKKNIAEIGVGIGATALNAVTLLGNGDTYYLFDFEDKVNSLATELKDYAKNGVSIKGYGNSHSLKDSYVWSLYNIYMDRADDNGVFDLVLVDGSHDFATDLSCVILIDKLLTKNGIIIIDDVSLTFEQICKEKKEDNMYNGVYSNTQLKSKQMSMICDVMFNNNPNYIKTLFLEDDCVSYTKK